MSTIKLCGLCDHFEGRGGLFGKCSANMRKEFDNNIFSSDVGCSKWDNPSFRRKKPKHIPRKIINFDEEKAKRGIGK